MTARAMGSGGNAVRLAQQRLQTMFSGPRHDKRLDGCDVGSCLRPLLEALGWRGEPRHLMEALPHFDDVDNLEELRAVLARLNFRTAPRRVKLRDLSDELLPCLFRRADGRLLVALERTAAGTRVYDGVARAETVSAEADETGTAYVISEIDTEESQARMARHGWMSELVRKLRRLVWQLLGITFLINVFALAVPIYTMNVYDKVIGTRSEQSLVYFLIGILIIVCADIALRSIRARALAYLGARCETLLGAASFQQLLNLPINMTERAPIGSQITRIKQFEGIRDIFTGTIASTALDLPFLLVFLGAVIVIGGPIAWVAVGLMVIYAIMAAVTIPLTRYHIGVTGQARSEQQNFLIEMLTKHRALKENRCEHMWSHRFRELAGESVIRHFRSQQLNMVVQSLSQSLVMAAGVATIWIGTLMVMAGDLSLGALIAVMALIWRLLSPINAAFLTTNRLGQVIQTFRQVNALMRLKLERVPGQVPSFYRTFDGQVSLSRAGFRYSARGEPALMGVTVDVAPGQFVAITGPSGAGKSTLLNVIAGLYVPQAGAVQIDGLDVRQLDVGELRSAIASVPQKFTFLHGTIDQNIRLAHPSATDEEIEAACREARVYDYESVLPEGRATRITTDFQRQMPDGLKQRLMLARAFVKKTPICLLDEPANNLDRPGETALVEKLGAMRGETTIFMVTHRPSHIRLADRVLYLEHGQVVHDGTPDQVLPLILDAA